MKKTLHKSYSMKIQLFSIIFIFLFLQKIQAQTINEDKISFKLMEQINEDKKSHYNIQIVLLDRIDLNAWQKNFEFYRLNKTQKVKQLIEQLEEKAYRTQIPILNYLRQVNGVIKQSITPLWITNMIQLKASKEVIQSLSNRLEIDYINLQPEYVYDKNIELNKASPKPNNSEKGLKTINAHKMWQLGYTGYGTKALIMDTGEDSFHPAITNQYYGNYVPDSLAWTGDDTPEAGANHGTHVTGTICGLDRLNNDTIGVAFNAKWMGGPISLTGTFFKQKPRSILETFQWALNPDNNLNTIDDIPDVINCSWGRKIHECGDEFGEISIVLELAGIPICWAGGNDGPDKSTMGMFQNWSHTVVNSFTIGALNQDNPYIIADFSSRGPSLCPTSGSQSLLIKPEVCAPGVNVRSCIPGGGYAYKNGTSMASPHVAGAILLLKEAFPYLNGEDLKLALYFSALDLGKPGEDNSYGMGLIDVYAAYLYLIDKGNQPIPPVSHNNDLILVGIYHDDVYCEENIDLSIIVENNGIDTIKNFILDIKSKELQTSVLFHDTIHEFIIPKQRKEIVLSFDRTEILSQKLDKNSYLNMTLLLSYPNGKSDDRKINNKTKLKVLIPPPLNPELSLNQTKDSFEICSGTKALITSKWTNTKATSRWFEREKKKKSISTTNNFLTTKLIQKTNYFIEPIFQNIGSSIQSNSDLLFDYPGDSVGIKIKSELPLNLLTTKVFSEEKGGLILQLCDQNNACITKTYFLEKGENKIDLNLSIFPTNNYKLFKMNGVNLGYNSFHSGYPYEYNELISILGPSQRDTSQHGYYYFYDLEVSYLYNCHRFPVIVDVVSHENVPQASFSIDDNVTWSENKAIEFYNKSTNSNTWLWNFGDGKTSTEEHPTHIFDKPGEYNVLLKAISIDGFCEDYFKYKLVLNSKISSSNPHFTDRNKNVIIFPNPSQDIIYISSENIKNEITEIKLFNLQGKFIELIKPTFIDKKLISIDISKFESGFYFLKLFSKKSNLISFKKIIIM